MVNCTFITANDILTVISQNVCIILFQRKFLFNLILIDRVSLGIPQPVPKIVILAPACWGWLSF